LFLLNQSVHVEFSDQLAELGLVQSSALPVLGLFSGFILGKKQPI